MWFLYQTEGVPKGISINSFYLQCGVPYNEFDKWFRKTHQSVAPFEVSGIPEVETPASANASCKRPILAYCVKSDFSVILFADFRYMMVLINYIVAQFYFL